jgi:hypothetical protein
MMSRYIGWRPRSARNSSHILSKHVQSDWEHSYAVDGQMDPPSCHYPHTYCRRRLPKGFNKISRLKLGYNDVMVHWLRPQTHMEWFPHPLQANSRCLRTFLCCGWADGFTILPLPLFMEAHIPILGSGQISGSKWAAKTSRCIGRGPILTWNGSHIHSKQIQGFDIILMLWMGTIMPLPYHTYCRSPHSKFRKRPKIWVTAVLQMMSRCIGWGPRPTWNDSHILSKHTFKVCILMLWMGRCQGALVEASDPHGMVPTSSPNRHTRCLRAFLLSCECAIESTTMPLPTCACWRRIKGVGWLIRSLRSNKWCQGVEAPDPHGMVSTSTPNKYKMLQNILMQWMGRWIHHHTSIIPYLLVEN